MKPRLVLLGGGNGLSNLMGGIRPWRERFGSITVGVAVSDNGGSSGQLRRQFGLPALGDLRRALAAFAGTEEAANFNTLIEGSEHKIGNRWLADRIAEAEGDFLTAIIRANERLATIGDVWPVTPSAPDLRVMLDSGREVVGESSIPELTLRDRIVSIRYKEPAEATPPLLARIAAADLIVIGPGSLYTSVIASLLPNGIVRAIQLSPAELLYVCNVSTERGETQGYGVFDHLDALCRCATLVPHAVVVNNRILQQDKDETRLRNIRHIEPEPQIYRLNRTRVIAADVVDRQRRLCHDPARLAKIIVKEAAKTKERADA